MKFHLEDTQKVFAHVQSSADGLTGAQAQTRLEQNGPNKLKEGKKESLIKRFLNQLTDPMIIILLAAAVISAITSSFAGEAPTDVFIILAVVLINAVLGVYQESKAEKAIEALQQMTAATSKVLRDGKIVHVKSEELVVGDVVVLEAGDAIPADGRLFECASLQIEEAALTGESVPANKLIASLTGEAGGDVPLGDRKNMAYMGSTAVYGRGKMVVTGAGMDTEMGKIADALAQAEDNQTPLQKKLAQLSKILSYIVIGICAFNFLFSLLRTGDFSGTTILNTFMVAVSLAVAAIPEGLATVVTIVLSIGVTNMSRRNAVIRKLTAVETLGCAQVICSDKTGTLTQNRMTVVDHYGEDEGLLARAMALCSDAEADDTGKATGESTECALVEYAFRLGLKKGDLKKAEPRVSEAPFDSMRKMMSTLHQTDRGIVQYTKGAPDEILKRCTRVLRGGQTVVMTEDMKKQVLIENKRMADKALRVLAASYRSWDKLPASTDPAALENDLIFIGLTGMIDPVRPEVVDAIRSCRSAGIRPVMITGDHKDTAVAIAKELGIITREDQAITGAQLDALSDAEFDEAVSKYSVYARVQPEHKVRIVKAWKKKGKITAMTGDGVNDAPSIKSADIGVGMGITGTDVTKNVADMVLADDNFATIVVAVEEGRRIYDNIRKAIQFLLASNLSEVLSIFTTTMLGFTILHPVHLLWINLVTDCFPALALGMEQGERDLMERPPRPTNDSVFSGGLGIDVIWQGAVVTLLTLLAYFIGHFMESGVWEITQSPDGITMAFLTMCLAELFHSMNMRSQTKSLFRLKTHNKYLWLAMLGSLLLTILVISVPFLANAFEFESISLAEFAVAALLGFAVIPIVELGKFIRKKLAK